MWDGQIDARHLYAALRLTVLSHERNGSTSKTVGSGTGFVVASRLISGRRKGFLVTNRHVLDPNFDEFTGKEVYAIQVEGFVQRTISDKGGSPLFGSAQPVRFTIESPKPLFAADWADVAVLDLETATIPEGYPDITELSNLRLAGTQEFADRLHVGAPVLIPGYPSIDQVTAHRPILVGGTVASDPREPAAIGRDTYDDSVLCHSFSWGGMSGSPVFALLPKAVLTWDDVERGNARELHLVGVNRGHVRIGGTAEGALTYFVKSTVLARLLRDVGTQGLWQSRVDDSRSPDGPELSQDEIEL